ncbi:MAG: OmpA family protein [Bernardetiaceae bacterium]|nr:OmpA family protein [Bernardetiaceae bacterium]
MIKSIICSIALILCCLNYDAYAQGTNSNRAERLYKSGVENLKARNFTEGIALLEKAIAADPNYFEAHYSLAINYAMLRKSEKAIMHYREAARIVPNSEDYKMLYIRLAEIEFRDGNYDQAQTLFTTFASFKAQNEQEENFLTAAKFGIERCKFAKNALKNPVPFEPKPMSDVLNFKDFQYFAVLTADEEYIYFTATDGHARGQDEDIFVSKQINGKWTAPRAITELNTRQNEGTCTISADGRTMIFTICNGSPDRPVIGRCDLFISYKKGEIWSKPQNMGSAVNSKHWDTQASLSADGNTIYFASDRPGGLGGVDIWYSTRDEQGEWGIAQNVGAPINTPGDEMGAFIHVNGRSLYFSSDGHLGMGNLDLFKAEKDDNGVWGQPKNLGYPINTNENQVGLFVTSDGKTAIYANEEVKNGEILSSKLYTFELPEEVRAQVASAYIKGTVYDAKTKKKLAAHIKLYNLENKQLESSVRSDEINGQYLFTLNEGGEYALNVNASGYLPDSKDFNMNENKENQSLTIDIYLQPIEKGSSMTLRNIFFDTDKADLKEKSKVELDILANFLKDNPKIKVEVAGHTDNVGAAAYNQNLSERRAQSVVNYLVEKQIPETQLIAKGYGQSKPAVANDSDENRKKNRRIELKILE